MREEHSNKKDQTMDSHSNLDTFQKHDAEWKKAYVNMCVPSNPIYVTFQNKQNKSTMKKHKVVASGMVGAETGMEQEGIFWDDGNVLSYS